MAKLIKKDNTVKKTNSKAKTESKPEKKEMAQLAVIKTGGKQYLVFPGKKIKIELLAEVNEKTEKTEKIEGKKIEFDQVLFLKKDNQIEIGTPLVKEAKVVAKILGQGKGKKVIIFKYKPKKRYKLKKGHRQSFIEAEITEIKTK
jgi:large subunit ribosomal protein L21